MEHGNHDHCKSMRACVHLEGVLLFSIAGPAFSSEERTERPRGGVTQRAIH